MKSFKSFIGCLFLTCVMCGSAYPNNPTYLINSVSHVLGNSYNNMRGLCFTLGVTVDNYQGKDVFACGKLCYKDNNGAWKDVPFSNTVSSNYECVGNVAMAIAKTNLSCCCQSSTTSKYELFLPYDAITHPSGNVDYKIVFWIRDAKDAGKFLVNKNGGYYHDYYFSLNWPGEARTLAYEIRNVSHNLNDTYNNMRGLCFTLGVTVDNYQGKDVFACGKLCYKDNNGAWKDVPFSNTVSSNYECAGNVAMAIAKTNLSCCCQSSTTSKYELFLPYDAITHPSGNVDYKIVFWIRDAKDAGKFLGNKNGGYYHDYYFSLNWPGEWPKGQTKVPATKATSNSKSTVQDPAEKAFIQDLIRTLNDDSRTLEYDEYVSTPYVFLEGKNIIFNFIVNEDMLKGIPMKELFQSADYNEAYLNKLLQDTFLSEGMSAEERADYLKLKKYGYKLYYRFIGSSSGEVINYQIDYESILK